MTTEDLLQALQEVEKRAERAADDEHVLATYVEAATLVAALGATDNGIVYGRRGTGKTHALRFLVESERAKGNFAVFVDIDKTLGSTTGVFGDTGIPLAQRATRLLVDVLALIHDALLEDAFAGKADNLGELETILDHFGEVLVASETEREETTAHASGLSGSVEAALGWGVTGPQLSLGGSSASHSDDSTTMRERVTGRPEYRVHLGAVSALMQRAIEKHPSRRFWLVFDEWSILPKDLQPYLAELLRRLFFGLSKVTVRIAAIPHRTEWRVLRADGGYVGLEVGAEVFPLLDLDEFVVFPARSRAEQVERSGEFFRDLLVRHLNQALRNAEKQELSGPDQLMSLLFTQVTAFHEMIRAAEGVPRDALTIVSRAALRAGDRKIATDHIRDAAAQVYQTTKASLLNAAPMARRLLDVIIAEVISEKRARAFLLAQDQTDHALIQQLIDDRILHLIKRGYSSKDDPGVRFDVLQIDYGCYVHLLRTASAPLTLFGEGAPEDDVVLEAMYADVDVPEDDYRAIRRAVLDLGDKLAAIGLEGAVS